MLLKKDLANLTWTTINHRVSIRNEFRQLIVVNIISPYFLATLIMMNLSWCNFCPNDSFLVVEFHLFALLCDLGFLLDAEMIRILVNSLNSFLKRTRCLVELAQGLVSHSSALVQLEYVFQWIFLQAQRRCYIHHSFCVQSQLCQNNTSVGQCQGKGFRVRCCKDDSIVVSI